MPAQEFGRAEGQAIAQTRVSRPMPASNSFLVAVIGLFGISEILLTMEERLALRGHPAKITFRVVFNVWMDLPRYWMTLLRSSASDAGWAITPGGAIAASFMGYNLAKRFSKHPENSGKGAIERRVRA